MNLEGDFLGYMKSYPVKENHIGSALSEILRYRQTNILLLYHKDFQMTRRHNCYDVITSKEFKEMNF